MSDAYDPLNYENLARSVVTALLENPLHPLPPKERFAGAGVYAIYYSGPLDFYGPISSCECRVPIYVGKAIPEGGRKGVSSDTGGSGSPLYNRLRQHAKSVGHAENLDAADFHCRFLVVVPIWITLAERFLTSHFKPVWNVTVDGFGNHDPGKGRRAMRRPVWDIVHPGRPWAGRLEADRTQEQVIRDIRSALESAASS